jgi:hypothetical protein
VQAELQKFKEIQMQKAHEKLEELKAIDQDREYEKEDI